MGAKKTFFLRPLYHLVRCSKNKLANKTGESLHLTVAPDIAIDQAWSNESGGSP